MDPSVKKERSKNIVGTVGIMTIGFTHCFSKEQDLVTVVNIIHPTKITN